MGIELVLIMFDFLRQTSFVVLLQSLARLVQLELEMLLIGLLNLLSRFF